MFFKCSFARACLILSELPIRTDQLPASIQQNILMLSQSFTADEWTSFVSILWSIWRCRNGLVYVRQQPTNHQFHKYLFSNSRWDLLVKLVKGPVREGMNADRQELGLYVCPTDASWISNWDSGLGFIIKYGELLLAYGVHSTIASCPLHAEAKALLYAIRYALEKGYLSCTFCTNSSILAKVASQLQSPTEVD